MRRLRYEVLPDGCLAPAPLPETPPPAPQRPVGLAGLFDGGDGEDEDDDMPEDVSSSFSELNAFLQQGEPPAPPQTADFALTDAGTAMLLCWPRNAERAVVPAQVEGCPVTAVAALAFAPMQLENDAKWAELYTSPVSFSVFCMRSGRWLTPQREGSGPREILLPDTITAIGAFAFWRCTRLEALTLPDPVEELGAGVFAGCIALRQLTLPRALRRLGCFPPATAQVMPDVGALNGCCALESLTLPPHLEALGAHVFNSCGIVTLAVQDDGGETWQRPFELHVTAFDHAAALQWMEKQSSAGQPVWRIGLPAARDKILRSDPKFGTLAQLPWLFFARTPAQVDNYALGLGRVDFLGRMAIARLGCPALLPEDTAGRYLDFLAAHYGDVAQFWPAGAHPAEAAFALMASSPCFTAAQLNLLLRQAGELHLPSDLIARMIELRNHRFDTVTGFEDLEL